MRENPHHNIYATLALGELQGGRDLVDVRDDLHAAWRALIESGSAEANTAEAEDRVFDPTLAMRQLRDRLLAPSPRPWTPEIATIPGLPLNPRGELAEKIDLILDEFHHDMTEREIGLVEGIQDFAVNRLGWLTASQLETLNEIVSRYLGAEFLGEQERSVLRAVPSPKSAQPI